VLQEATVYDLADLFILLPTSRINFSAVLHNSATAFTATRLAGAAVFNLAFSLTLICILRLLKPALGAWLLRLLLSFRNIPLWVRRHFCCSDSSWACHRFML
jgi:hypothetical protein